MNDRFAFRRLARKLAFRIKKYAGIKEIGAEHQPGYPKVTGPRYEAWLKEFHGATSAEWYLEIGTETGKSLVPVQSNTISIDPNYRLRYDVMGSKTTVHLFQLTSDAFFMTDFLARNDIRIGVAFLDGMHEFEFLLRDFINVERASRPDGTIFAHDCMPANRIQARRDHASLKTRFWTGDVWKLLPILRQYRRDLEVKVLDLAPTGLVMIRGLDPANLVLSDRYEEIVQAFLAIELEAYGLERFAREFPLVSAPKFSS